AEAQNRAIKPLVSTSILFRGGNKMRKLLLLIISIVFVGILAACGSGSEEEASKEADANSTDDGNTEETSEVSGELEFYTSQPDVDAEQLVEAFNEKYPDVKVNIFRSGT